MRSQRYDEPQLTVVQGRELPVSGQGLLELMRAVLARSPMLRLEYASIADAKTLEECTRLQGPTMASIAVRLGQTRLIDNVMLLDPNHGAH